MVTPQVQKIIVAVVAFLFVGFLAYNLVAVAPDISSAPVTEADVASQKILALVSKFQNLSIDQALFSSPLFTSLVDIEVVPSLEVEGRLNPFSPIGNDLIVNFPTVSPKPKGL
jgi:hypothetical protein